MPYASREDLPISEERFRRLASDLSHTTAKNYAYYLLNYPDRARENSLWASAQRMIDG